MKLGDFFDSRYVTTKKKVFKKCVEKLNSYKKIVTLVLLAVKNDHHWKYANI